MADLVRLGLIGVGRWGKVYIRTILSLGERCRLTHLGTSKPQNASLVPSGVHVEADWRRIVESDCDAVIIATPPATHADIVEHCVDAGKPCLVEKPLCLDVPTAERLHQRVGRSGVPVLVDHTLLFSPAYLVLRQRLRESREPIRVIVSEGMALGPFRTEVSALWDWCPHDFSLCLDLMGQYPVQVAALGGPPDHRGDPELLAVRLEFSGGVWAWVQAGRLSPIKRRSLSVFTDAQVYGFDDLAAEPLTVAALSGTDMRTIPVGSTQRPMERMLDYFLDGVQGGDRCYFGTSLALDVVRVLATCDAALKPEVSPSTS